MGKQVTDLDLINESLHNAWALKYYANPRAKCVDAWSPIQREYLIYRHNRQLLLAKFWLKTPRAAPTRRESNVLEFHHNVLKLRKSK